MSLEEELAFLQQLGGQDDAARAAAAGLDTLDADTLVGDGLELLLAAPLEEEEERLVVPVVTLEPDETKLTAERDGADRLAPPDAEPGQTPVAPQRQEPRPAPKKSVYVNRTKQELEYLRQEIVELEQQLARATPPVAVARQVAALARQQTGASSLWERVASRQKEERRRAEVENEKLREMLDGQLRIARSLEKVLRKRAANTALLSSPAAGIMKRHRPDASRSLDDIFAMLSSDLEDAHGLFESAMRQTGLDSLRGEINDAQAMLDSSGELYMELRHAVAVPFDVQRTSEAMWRFLSMTQQNIPNGYMTATDCTDDTICIKVYVTLRLRRSEALVCVHLLVRRFIEEHRVLLVSSSFGVSEGSLFDGETIHLRETNWTAIEPAASSADASSDERASIIKTCLRMWPSFASATSNRSHLETMIDLVIASYAQNMKAFVQIIENLLLSQSLED